MKKKPISQPNPEMLAQQARREYGPPVDVLFEVPALDFGQKWPDYSPLPLVRSDASELQKMACDFRLDYADALWSAPMHAMRVLSTWGDPSFLPALFQTFPQRDEHDFFYEDLPKVIARLGPPAIETVQGQLDEIGDRIYFLQTLSDGLVRIAQASRPHHAQIVEIFRGKLEKFAQNDPGWNGFLISNLTDLAAGELLPLIEKVFRAGAADPMIRGDLDDIRAEFGLAAPRHNYHSFLSVKTSQGVLPPFSSSFKKGN